MPNIREFGTIPNGYVIQPDSELVYHDDGLIEGTVIFKGEYGKEEELKGLLGTSHPEDGDVMLYAMRLRRCALNLLLATYDCIGTKGRADTERIVVPVPSQEMIPIEAHPEFLTDKMAGPEPFTKIDQNYAHGLNGAMFQTAANGKPVAFLGFLGDDAPHDLRGVRMYQRNTPVLRSTWYTWTEPAFQSGSQIVESPQGAPTLPGISNFLRSAPVGVRVGGLGGDVLWKVTQEYVGSEDGVSTTIYGSPVDE